MPLRYWALCRILSEQGHEVIWWSSDFSHRTKTRREACPPTHGFSIRLIPTDSYTKNVSFARIKSHQQFSRIFLSEALSNLKSKHLNPPNRIVVSLPPLGIAESAFNVSEFVNTKLLSDEATPCQVIVDIMDAWPETFERVFPSWLPKRLTGIPLGPLYRSAKNAYTGADKISAVSQQFLDIASPYSQEKGTKTYLCYHGADLSNGCATRNRTIGTPVKLAYIGALETSYDLIAIIQAAKSLNQNGTHTEFHIAGAGSKEGALKKLIPQINQAADSSIIFFHGYLQRVDLDALLNDAHFGMIPMKNDSFVGLPYKIADYTRIGLPILSSLEGECRELIEHKKAGAFYHSGSSASLVDVIQSIIKQPALYHSMSINSRQIAEQLFDRSITYPELANFVTSSLHANRSEKT